jgi:hypothetical protein
MYYYSLQIKMGLKSNNTNNKNSSQLTPVWVREVTASCELFERKGASWKHGGGHINPALRDISHYVFVVA